MPNINISDLPLVLLPMDLTQTFFEVQTIEGGIPVSRRVAGDNLTNGTAIGFYGTTPIAQQTGVAVTAAAIHAALVNLGLITA